MALSLLVLPAALPAAGAPRRHEGASVRRAHLADADDDQVDDVLERRLRGADRLKRHPVVVATDGSLGIPGARAVAGPFVVSRRLGIVHGFSAQLTSGQIRRLAATPGVLRIDHDGVVRATMDAARADYGVEAARAEFGLTGAGVTVCVLDTGVDPDHEQLDSKTIAWQDFVGTSTTPFDDHGHGTHVASIAVGDGVGGAQAARFGGVAPAADLWVGKVLDGTGFGTESGIIDAIDWCAGAAEVDVISMSLGSELPSDGSDVLGIAANQAVADGKVVVAAAGNAGDAPDTMSSPGAAPDVIAVGASSSWSAADKAVNHSEGIFLAPFSSRGGPTFAADQKPDVVAPGVNVMAANSNTAAAYEVNSGTSMATPFVAGSVALALEAWTPGSPTPDAVQAVLEATADDHGAAGKDPEWGAGVIDVLAFTASAAGSTAEHGFPTQVDVAGAVPDGGEWTYEFAIGAGDLDVPIAASIVTTEGSFECTVDLPPFGCLLGAWLPDIDAQLFDPNGDLVDESICGAIGIDDPYPGPCTVGRQETLHALPTVAGTYMIRVVPFDGDPNFGVGAAFQMDLSTGPVGGDDPPPPPPPPSAHVRDLDDTSVRVSASKWRARVAIRVHDGDHTSMSGVVVRGRFGPNGSVLRCTTGAGGACSLQRDLPRSRASIVFTVLSLTKSGYTYRAAANHDPDGDSNGSRITVTRP